MLDGEHWVMPADVILSITEPVIPEAAAPTMASTSSVSNRSTVVLAISGSVPESPGVKVTSAPLTPPAALISAIAMLTPSSNGADKMPGTGLRQQRTNVQTFSRRAFAAR
ncbi:MAG: hypothetical protein CM15mP49_34330 [Actinomycetota bacterium]|nr:MAG: hypothetical protein CM15mP49_34330 [Actinomycetota bacterium]